MVKNVIFISSTSTWSTEIHCY